MSKFLNFDFVGSNMPYQAIEKGELGSGGSSIALVSIRKSESIGINSEALEGLGEAKYVKLYQDTDDETKLAIAQADEDDDDAYKLSMSNGSATVGCASALRQRGLIPEITTRYEPTQVEIDGRQALEIDLDDEYDTYGSLDDDDSSEDNE